MMSRAPDRQEPLALDPTVGPHSELREIHAWLDELERQRRDHCRDAAAQEIIEREVARVVGWLQGKDELAGEFR